MSTVTVSVDAERCVGSATCSIVAPGSFVLNEHDRAEPTSPVTADADAVEEAAQLCPTGAILVVPAGE
jgi:ferredoxin